MMPVSPQIDEPQSGNQQDWDRSCRNLMLGFGCVLLILLLIAVHGALRIWVINGELEIIVEVHEVKNTYLGEMRDAIRERQIFLREMVVSDDIFDRASVVEANTQAASRYLVAREGFLNVVAGSVGG